MSTVSLLYAGLKNNKQFANRLLFCQEQFFLQKDKYSIRPTTGVSKLFYSRPRSIRNALGGPKLYKHIQFVIYDKSCKCLNSKIENLTSTRILGSQFFWIIYRPLGYRLRFVRGPQSGNSWPRIYIYNLHTRACLKLLHFFFFQIRPSKTNEIRAIKIKRCFKLTNGY